MSVETATTISELDETWPLSGDVTKEGDDHIRLLKSMLIAQFPGALSNGFAIPIIATEAELNYLTGLTSNAQAQFDALDSRITGLEGVLSAPAGTRLTFNQASVPAVGWTQDITFNNHMMRVVSGLGGGNGGSDSPILNDKIPTHNHSATSGNDSHSHTSTLRYSGLQGGQTNRRQASGATGTQITSEATSSDIHNHSITVNNNAGSNWTPKYIDCIIGVKD